MSVWLIINLILIIGGIVILFLDTVKTDLFAHKFIGAMIVLSGMAITCIGILSEIIRWFAKLF